LQEIGADEGPSNGPPAAALSNRRRKHNNDLQDILSGQSRIRTDDPSLFRAVLYRLSYLSSAPERFITIGASALAVNVSCSSTGAVDCGERGV
jgi:hypothetical protein